MQKRSWMLIMAICLCFSLLLQGPALGAKSFSDVKGHWANTYISSLTAKGYLNGYPDGTFKPDRSMSRAEFVTALITCLGIAPSQPVSNSFTDTKNHWARKYIEEAVERDIVIPSEFPAGFGPDQEILRSQAAAMLVRAMGLYPSSAAVTFTDKNDVGRSMYRDHIKAINDAGVMNGFPDGSFKPFQAMNRAQVCTVLVKMLEKQGSLPVVDANGINTVAVGEDLFTLGKTTIAFDTGSTDTNISSLSVAGSNLTVNGRYVFTLNQSSGNPDIIIGNTRYEVSRMTVSSNKLVVYPASRRINELKLNSQVYASSKIKMYIGSDRDYYYLSDLEVTDENNVVIKGDDYRLSRDEINIEVSGKRYEITKISLTAGSTTPSLKEAAKALSMSDIASITVGTKELDLDDIDEKDISFIVGGKEYDMSETYLDSAGRFTINDDEYSYKNVSIKINSSKYKISDLDYVKGEFEFTCSKLSDQVKFNSKTLDYDEVTLIKGSTEYDLEDVTYVSRNVIKISGKKYTVTETDFQCEVDNKLYDVEKIDWSSTSDMMVITAEEVDTFDPDEIILYDQEYTKLGKGYSSTVKIKVGTKWLSLSAVEITAENKFTYSGKSYSLTDSRIKIGLTEYIVDETIWHTNSETLDIILMEL